MSAAPLSREEMDFAHIEKRLPDWAGREYGYIATVSGLTRTRVKRAIRWALEFRRDIVIVGPTSKPGENTLDISPVPTRRSLKYARWNIKYSMTRIRNRIQFVMEQHAAAEIDATDRAIMENLAANARASAEQLERDLVLMEILIAKSGGSGSAGASE